MAKIHNPQNHNGENLATEKALTAHTISTTGVHISETERTKWNTVDSKVTGVGYSDRFSYLNSFYPTVTDASKFFADSYLTTYPNIQVVLNADNQILTTIRNHHTLNAEALSSESNVLGGIGNLHVSATDRANWNNASSHTSQASIHVSAADREKWDNPPIGSPIEVIFHEDSIYSADENEKQNYIVYDANQNPTYISFAKELTNITRLFASAGMTKFHIKEFPNATTSSGRVFHNCRLLKSFKCNMPKLTSLSEFVAGCNMLEYFEGDFSAATNFGSMFNNCNILKEVKVVLGSVENAKSFIASLPSSSASDKHISMNFTSEQLGDSYTTLVNNGWTYTKIDSL